MVLYHVTTPKKARCYRDSGYIEAPVRGFDTLIGAMYWAMKTGRTVIYEVTCEDGLTYKLPDHHNEFGIAYWTEDVITTDKIKCVVSAQ